MAAQRRLASTLTALHPSTGPVDLSVNHPSFQPAPSHWKYEPDHESAARFTKTGTLTPPEQQTLTDELVFFREHGCIMIPDALARDEVHHHPTSLLLPLLLRPSAPSALPPLP